MSRKVPRAAFVEEYDEDADVSLPETRQSANVTAKRSKSDLRKPAREPFVEAASDSGYSSRTAATVNSTQSAPSGSRHQPLPLKVDTSHRRADLERVRSRTKEHTRDRSARPSREDKMHAGPYSAGYPPAHLPRSPSVSQRPERMYPRNYPSNYWDAERNVYHASTPVEPRQREYRYHSSQASSYDYPPPSPSPQTSRYPPAAVVQVSSSRPQGRPTRSNSYHANNRPVSFHGQMPSMNGMMYSSSPVGRFEHGPPLSSSAYVNSPAYPPGPPSIYAQQAPYYPYPDAASPPERLDRSMSRPREQPRQRRPSVFEPPAMDYDSSEEEEEEEEEEDMEEELMEPSPPPPPPGPPRQARPRMPLHHIDRREDDFYPPPPLKQRAPPQIIHQKRPELHRKPATTPSVVSERRGSRSLDLSELQDVLPPYGYYRGPSGPTIIPERNRSLRRPSVYHDSSRSGHRIAVENSSRRRRPTVYDFGGPGDEIEEKLGGAEEYQASQSGKSAAPPISISDALLKAKASSQVGSDSGSQKSRSASSRGSGSEARTRSASGALTTTRAEDDDNIVMTLNGVTMNFTQESLGGKRISVRSGNTGAVELNIEGKRPKKYLTGGSEYTTASGGSRKGDRKSDRASRRSSRSTYAAPR
ncbi:uncharacterized protein DSM5745_06756 [Aspergillus mulundensis]|uniref:Uncharacterized protein n=1 Tax=Aspergillus mulundensis TaxID=1810919 RepID=A0A3D8RSB9_9EURO|nr:Uncharacterized protein DSM5745_06756 [Aspergillus mulundensis]RDW76764.1 Uncharacterized protein DSM5745_06756 [Aspergillus mulundensis]